VPTSESILNTYHVIWKEDGFDRNNDGREFESIHYMAEFMKDAQSAMSILEMVVMQNLVTIVFIFKLFVFISLVANVQILLKSRQS